MHEILAPILWAVERDAIDPQSISANNSQIVTYVCDVQYVVHDAYTIFSALMESLKWSYAPTAEGNLQTSGGCEDNSFSKEVLIVQRSRRILEKDLARVDPELSGHLRSLEIAPQLFLM